MNIKCVITDDEPVARKGLQSYVDRIDFLHLEAVCSSGVELNNFLAQTSVDLLFLDIEMPYLSGVELLQNLARPPKVIFTTAYEKYALKGYELDVVDYLLKPVTFERFLKAANKAVEVFSQKSKNIEEEDFFIKTNGKLVKLSWKEILSIEGMENYICIYTQQTKYIAHFTMKAIIEKMPGSFIQIHKSILVNMDAITGIEGNTLELGIHRVTMSRNLREPVLERILNNKLLKK